MPPLYHSGLGACAQTCYNGLVPDDDVILIAEDERPLAKALKLKLTDIGLKVKVVSNGQEAIDALKLERFSLVLMDLVMPGVDGFGLLEYIQNSGVHIPVVVLSNLNQQSDRNRAFKLGATDYFVKADMQLSEIVDKIKGLLGR